GCEHIGTATVSGILYDMDGRFPALVLYGTEPVEGEVWRCPPDVLWRLDEYEGTASGLFRRVAVEVTTRDGDLPCWVYTAGPALSRKLVPGRQLRGGRWPMDEPSNGIVHR
ncbi:MAG TPA: gamma-glutamylcyclotransferase family protein, partial [Longimicrobiales bacterium]|nr:gamma-glutamylcyclotransferase family protein [Longimicrobiales bacterium]